MSEWLIESLERDVKRHIELFEEFKEYLEKRNTSVENKQKYLETSIKRVNKSKRELSFFKQLVERSKQREQKYREFYGKTTIQNSKGEHE